MTSSLGESHDPALDAMALSPKQGRELLARLRRHEFIRFLPRSFASLNPGKALIPEWYIEAIAYQLERVRSGECTRLAISMPPRSLKSIMVSVAWPAFLLGNNPTLRIITASYAQDLSRKFSADFRSIITSDWYHQSFPGVTQNLRKDTQNEIELNTHGGLLATSVGGTLTGRGGDIIIIDDPLKANDATSTLARDNVNQWFTNTLVSRLNEKLTGSIVIVMQRVHMADLIGFVTQNSKDWTVLSLPAIAEADAEIPLLGGRTHFRKVGDVLSPTREPLKKLEEIKRDIGGALFSAQYQQAPVPPEGAMIRRAWLRRGDPPPREEWRCIVQSWDTASKGGPNNDYSVCTTWLFSPDQRRYLLDVFRDRLDYPALKGKVQALANQWGATQVLVEDSGTATGLLQELKYQVRGITGVRPERDKVSRLAIVSAQFEAGQIIFAAGSPWIDDLEVELLSFPGGVHDDQVDSISQALAHGNADLAIWASLGRRGPPR